MTKVVDRAPPSRNGHIATDRVLTIATIALVVNLRWSKGSPRELYLQVGSLVNQCTKQNGTGSTVGFTVVTKHSDVVGLWLS